VSEKSAVVNHPAARLSIILSLVLSSEFIRADEVAFERDVLPILEKRCSKCHGEKRQKGKLRVDTLAGIARGGESGAIIARGVDGVASGKPEESRLLVAISWKDDDFRMPPKSRIPDDEMVVLRRWIEQGARELASVSISAKDADRFSAEDRAYWFFRQLERPSPPSSPSGDVENPIDAFVLARLSAANLEMAPAAERRTLIRRLSYDLRGGPPSPEEIAAFLLDDSLEAYEKLVDRILASPGYGERWARHWLDLVRYSDSNGYRADEYRPYVWRYRDWVVGAFNDDKTYDRFVSEQLAGDELHSDDRNALVATGFLRLWPYESNQKDVRRQWSDIVNDITDVTGAVFLGLSMGCARCHDHKFDPILQEDYYRLRAFVGTILPKRGLTLGSRQEKRDYDASFALWEEKTRSIREKIRDIETRHYAKPAEKSIIRFPEEFQPVLRAKYDTLAPLEKQQRTIGRWQVEKEAGSVGKAVKGKDAERRKQLIATLEEFDRLKPKPLAEITAVVDVGPVAPINRIPGKTKRGDVLPGYLSIFDPKPAAFARVDKSLRSSGRRATLVRWLTRKDNQLTTRVIVNRIWQYHFGRGIVATANDFGRQGESPTHPELLEWLATEFIERGWGFKDLHRSILLSRVYRQRSVVPKSRHARESDDGNTLLWRMRVRRLSAEQLRDAMLTASGELAARMGGAGVEEASTRRAIYMKVLRNKRASMMDAFDGPDGFNSCARRDHTTTAPQALLLLNGEWTLKRATAMARRVEREAAEEPSRRIERAYEIALGRLPDDDERSGARSFLARQAALIAVRSKDEKKAAAGALVDLCHALFNANEFLYVD
jgi:hypothetical protein